MSFSASAPVSAKRPMSLLKKHLVTGCFVLLSCLGIEPVLAAGECSLSPISAQTHYGQGGATLVFSSKVGAKFTYSHSTDGGVVLPHVQVEWEHEFKDDPAQITTRFLNDTTAIPTHKTPTISTLGWVYR